MPWSIVPYISMLPPRSPAAPAPPCAQAAQTSAAASKQKIFFIVASYHVRPPAAAAFGHSTRAPQAAAARFRRLDDARATASDISITSETSNARAHYTEDHPA